METTAERLRIALDMNKMKQSDLVKKTGINKGALSSYLSGKYLPKQNSIYAMAKALNVSEGWLMGFDVPMERKIAVDIEIEEKPEEIATAKRLLNLLHLLNQDGLAKLEERAEELTEMAKYTKKEENITRSQEKIRESKENL